MLFSSPAWDAVVYWALDLETGGLDPRADPILAVGLVPVREGTIRLGEAFRSLVCPQPALPGAGIMACTSTDAAPTRASTKKVRELLPATVPHADAAANSARAALLSYAVTTDPALLLAATEDRLHQHYRAPAMPGSPLDSRMSRTAPSAWSMPRARSVLPMR